MALDVAAVRARFPALGRIEQGRTVAYLDGPAGTQVPIGVIEATASLQRDGISNLGGPFETSRRARTVTDAARAAMGDFFHADPSEVVFGQNMTSLTFAASRAIGRTWDETSRVLITTLDHAANRDPWRLVAEDTGATVDEVRFDSADGLLHPDAVIDALRPETEVVAVTAASNALGSVTDLEPIVAAAHEFGALVYVDAVHFCAHRLPHVANLRPDFLVASAYKFFGPHTGILYGRKELLETITPYKLRPAPGSGPGRWETGTQAFESLAGVTAAVDYLAGLGEGDTRRERLESAFSTIAEHEDHLSARFLAGISAMPGVRLHGPGREGRVATFAVTVDGLSPAEVSAELARRSIQTWDGHYYATAVMDQLDLARNGGAVRIGFVHYTSVDEVDRVLEALDDLS